MKSALAPVAHDYRILWAMLGGNLGGVLLTVAYFRFLHPAVLQHENMHSVTELGYFLAACVALVVAGRSVARRWSHRLRLANGVLPSGAVGDGLRKGALLVPARLAVLSFACWIAAAVLWGIAWPLWTESFSLIDAVRKGVGLVFVSGTVVSVYIFLAIERIWRERIPHIFPDGALTAAKAPKLRVRTRMVILFMLMSVLPMAVLSVATLGRTNALLQVEIETPEVVINNLVVLQVVLAVTGLFVAMRLANYVADSVSQPLRMLVSSMRQVKAGNLQVHCPVVSNDELGEAGEGFNQMVQGLREREEIRETFGRYVSPQVRDEILTGRAKLEGGLREVSVLFADLRGFTSWVESTDPTVVVADLNVYFTEMDTAIRECGGLVLQYIGDEIEAVFGAPQADSSHADHAVAAALAMQSRLDAWNITRRAAGKPELHHGIGIHSGKVVAGSIGSPSRMSYSLVGDVVNVASRIQSLNKELGTRVLVSAVTRQSLSAKPPMRPFPSVRVKGRVAEVEVFALG
ncbi:adenylate/guanylate cyclase domain-containing protein [Comamonadaceae bacterium G21597-S1]|nr:adenylate/guanylate cyclase domain-containing protein [Comamonadaceae bacterium G21597-S1]